MTFNLQDISKSFGAKENKSLKYMKKELLVNNISRNWLLLDCLAMQRHFNQNLLSNLDTVRRFL